MSLRIALQGVGIVVAGLVLLWGFLAMGPLAWVVIGTMLVIGVLQVLRDRRRSKSESGELPAYCANCGSALALDAHVAGGSEDAEWELDYCPDCGAPVAPAGASGSVGKTRNCPDCGAPNDPT